MTDIGNSPDVRVALVTGANRGIGYAVARGLAQRSCQVILTARDAAKGAEAASDLKAQGLAVDFVLMDVRNESTIRSAAQFVHHHYGRLDTLVNNAGILPDNEIEGTFKERSILETPPERFLEAFETNALGVIAVCRHFVPLLKHSRSGRIVNISSQVAQLSSMDSGLPAYRLSKVSLNAITRILADELKPDGILCNAISPGWVKTEMGGPNATVSAEEAAAQIIELACMPPHGPTGEFFRDGKVIAW